MDIPALSMAMAQQKLATSVSLSVMKMAMENMEQTGQQIAELIQSYTIDIKV